jgi:hypothetical protein
VLCDNLLGANWSPQALPRLAILVNSFATYAERWSGPTQHTPYVTHRAWLVCLSSHTFHIQGVLCDNLLGANWSPQALPRLAILGNSFSTYAERWSGPPGLRPSTTRPDRLLALVQAGEQQCQYSFKGYCRCVSSSTLVACLGWGEMNIHKWHWSGPLGLRPSTTRPDRLLALVQAGEQPMTVAQRPFFRLLMLLVSYVALLNCGLQMI